ncbi:hypothetical protein [Nonomuraea sp. NPDC049480]|uniref:hypothetical protein n=1 Tax=Nonomuraea sp. NPDC049480 TaxID=3364353 RepID=UPI00379273A6
MKLRRAATVSAGAVSLIASCLVPSSAAEAAVACDVQIGTTYKSGNYIVGYGSLSGCPSTSTADLYIQRQVIPGWWKRASGIATAHQGYDTYVRYNCSGTGTQSWRTLIYGRTIGGSARVKSSNTIRVNCG